MNRLAPFAIAVLALWLAALPARAAPPEDMVQMDILPGWITPQGTRMVGLRLRLAPGWKTYWRAPGDAGIPPLFDWAGSQNIAAADLHWPVPQVFVQAGMRSIGYEGEVVIPIELAPTTPGAAQRMAGEVEIGVCEEICVPVRLTFDVALPAEQHRDAGIVAALIDQPASAEEAGVSGVQCSADPIKGGLRLTARLLLPSTGGHETVVIEARDPTIWVSEAQTRREGDTLIAAVDMIQAGGVPLALNRSGLRFTVLGRDRAVDIIGCTAG